jgi:carbon-monoxide dehydrogenase small subunit
MRAEGFLAERPAAGRAEIREVVSSNLCRCTGYQPIVDAIEDCANQREASRTEPDRAPRAATERSDRAAET